MANLTESNRFESGIYQIETKDPVLGGPDGISNLQARQLANRTIWLKDQLNLHQNAEDPHPQYMTLAESDNRIQVAIQKILNFAPEALNTLGELSKALNDDPQFAATLISNTQNQTYTAFSTTGKTGEFLLSPNPSLDKYRLNTRFRVKFHAPGNGADTLSVSGLSPQKIKQFDASGAKIAATIFANQLADIEYDGNDFLILNPLPISSSPAGSIIYVAQNTAPTGYLKANGAAVSRTAYATLFSTIGTTFGVGDGSSTFNLPDLRSEFIRGWDDGRGIDASRLFGSAQAATAIRVLIDNYLNYSIGTYAVGMRNVDESLRGSGNQNRTIGSDNNFYTNPATINLGSDDNQAFTVRPRNIALLACIKY